MATACMTQSTLRVHGNSKPIGPFGCAGGPLRADLLSIVDVERHTQCLL